MSEFLYNCFYISTLVKKNISCMVSMKLVIGSFSAKWAKQTQTFCKKKTFPIMMKKTIYDYYHIWFMNTTKFTFKY